MLGAGYLGAGYLGAGFVCCLLFQRICRTQVISVYKFFLTSFCKLSAFSTHMYVHRLFMYTRFSNVFFSSAVSLFNAYVCTQVIYVHKVFVCNEFL